MEFLTTPDFKLNSLIKIIGLGGAGGNAVKHMVEIGIKDVDYIICNTDAQALENSPVNTKIHMGASLTKGRGAGNQPEIGLNAAKESLDDIKAAIGVDTRMVFITAGMGGGTGTGASPVVAEACRELGILTVGIVTTPFKLEGPKRINQANEGLDKLAAVVDCLMVISNDSILTNYGNMTQSKAFAMANDVVATAAKSIAEIITISGNTNVDFADVETVLRDSGVAIMGSGSSKGDHRAINAVEQALASPLLTESNIYGAKNILLNIGSGHQEVTMDEIAIMINHLQKVAGGEANLIWGSYLNDELDDNLHLTVLATGFKKKPDAIEQAVLKVNLSDSNKEVVFETPKENLFDLPKDDPYQKPEDAHLNITLNKMQDPEFHRYDGIKERFKAVELKETEQPIAQPKPTEVTKVILFDETESQVPSASAAEDIQQIIQNINSGNANLNLDKEETKVKPSIQDEPEPAFKLEAEPPHAIGITVREISTEEANRRNLMNELPKSDHASQIAKAAINTIESNKQRMNNLKKFNNVQALSNENVNELESVPAYLRNKVEINPVTPSSESLNSGLSVGIKNNTIIQTNNSFLSKNTD